MPEPMINTFSVTPGRRAKNPNVSSSIGYSLGWGRPANLRRDVKPVCLRKTARARLLKAKSLVFEAFAQLKALWSV